MNTYRFQRITLNLIQFFSFHVKEFKLLTVFYHCQHFFLNHELVIFLIELKFELHYFLALNN